MSDPIRPEFSRRIRVADLRNAARSVSEKADAGERAALTRRFGVVAVPRLSFTAEIRPWRDGWKVTGVARARVTQTCVATLADVDQVIEEPFERRFLPGAQPAPAEQSIDPEGEDPPEPLGDSIELGEIAAETVALSLDPYPRAAGAEYVSVEARPAGAAAPEEDAPRPFAGLAALRDKLGSGNG